MMRPISALPCLPQFERSSDVIVTTPAAVRDTGTTKVVVTSCVRRQVMDDAGQSCVECLGPVSTAVHSQNGARLCPQCAEQFYRSCAGCGGLIPQDEAMVRDGALYCIQCLAAPISKDNAAALSDEALA